MVTTQRWLKPFRTLHLYLGVFTAPALLFFAFTGGLQSLDLHEASRTGDYKPPAWLASASHMHKKQSFDIPVKRAAPAPAFTKTGAASPAAGRAKLAEVPAARQVPVPARRNLWPMKIFFVLVSSSLILSTLTGLCMGWRYTRNRHRYGATLAAGVVVPVLLLLF